MKNTKMYLTEAEALKSSDSDLMAAYRARNDAGEGERIGEGFDSPRRAAEREEWTVIRAIYEDTNDPGTPVLADDGAGALYVICELYGPWAVRVGGDR
jgi:hypothetical protein